MNSKLIFVVLSSYIVIVNCLPAGPKKGNVSCEVQEKRTDLCIRRALLAGFDSSDLIVPQNLQDINRHCARLRKDVRCVTKYGRCLNLFPKTVFGIILGNVRKTMNGICRNDKEKLELLKVAKCFKNENLVVIHRVSNEMTTIFDYIAANVTQNDIIPWSCCTYFTTLNVEARRKIKDICGNDDKAADYIINIIKSVATDVIDIGCGKYANPENCERHLPEGMRIIKDLIYPPSRVPQHEHTLLIGLLQIARRLDNDFDGLR